MLAILACPSRDSGDAWDADEVSERALGQAPKAIHHAGAGVVHQLDRASLTGLERTAVPEVMFKRMPCAAGRSKRRAPLVSAKW